MMPLGLNILGSIAWLGDDAGRSAAQFLDLTDRTQSCAASMVWIQLLSSTMACSRETVMSPAVAAVA